MHMQVRGVRLPIGRRRPRFGDVIAWQAVVPRTVPGCGRGVGVVVLAMTRGRFC